MIEARGRELPRQAPFIGADPAQRKPCFFRSASMLLAGLVGAESQQLFAVRGGNRPSGGNILPFGCQIGGY